MVQSRGGVTGGATITDAIREYESRGYTGHFTAATGGVVECQGCRHKMKADDVAMRSMRRIEGASDPADMVLVGALECPHCHARGVMTLAFGPHSAPEEAAVLRHLADVRPSQALNEESDDGSLVKDTGWLR